MSNKQMLKAMINERLSKAAEEIFGLFELSVAEYKREIDRLKTVNEAKQMDCSPSPHWSSEGAQQMQTVRQENEESTESFLCKEETEQLLISREDKTQMLITNVTSLNSGDESKPHGQQKQQRVNSEGPEEPVRGGADTDHSFQPSSESEEEEEDTDSEDEPFGSDASKKPFSCFICKKHFHRKRGVKMHMKWAHRNQEPLTSAECHGHLDPEKLSLSQTDMDSINHRSFSCAICKREFKFKLTLQEHLKMHAVDNFYKCTVCVASFPSHVDFICHMKTVHSIDEPFQCSVCNKSLKNVRNYRTHMLIHTGERPYVCSVCGRGFLQSGNLKYHMLTHTGEKPFSCSECGARYTSKQNLLHHKKESATEMLDLKGSVVTY